jgi:hypothetical protein
VTEGGKAATGADLIEDKLWLPTEWEMFGEEYYSNHYYETAANQAQFEYYTSNTRRIKYTAASRFNDTSYLVASPCPVNDTDFCAVGTAGKAIISTASGDVGGCAPAFCVR